MKRLLAVMFVLVLASSVGRAEPPALDPATKAAAESLLNETPQQRDQRTAWWRDAKFGLFLHWGPSALSGKEISWSRIGHPFDHPGNEVTPAEVYDNLYKQFNPVKFNADEWMQVAKEAGVKYIVFTTKHHDGFSMWPTKLRADYSITATPFQRDICKELADAAHKHGIKLGWYYSTRDWTHPDYLKDGNAKYNDFYHGQVRELLTNYGQVDVLWFDHVAGNWSDYRFEELFGTIRRLQPNIVVNNRGAAFVMPPKDKPSPEIAKLTQGDYGTPEQQVGAFQTDRSWESCITMTECKDGGGWSYRPDGRTRTFAECLGLLVKAVTGGGNLLLNIGPLPDGTLDPVQVQNLKQMGQWLGKYGESIYGTRGGPLCNGEWGGATHKGNTVYLHVLKWPADSLKLPAISQKIVQSKVLTGGAVKVTQTDGGTEISVAEADRDPVDTIIALTLDAAP